MGPETYVILVVLLKKKNAKCITFTDFTKHLANQTHSRGPAQDLRKACPGRGLKLKLRQPHSKSASGTRRDTCSPSPFSLNVFLALTGLHQPRSQLDSFQPFPLLVSSSFLISFCCCLQSPDGVIEMTLEDEAGQRLLAFLSGSEARRGTLAPGMIRP